MLEGFFASIGTKVIIGLVVVSALAGLYIWGDHYRDLYNNELASVQSYKNQVEGYKSVIDQRNNEIKYKNDLVAATVDIAKNKDKKIKELDDLIARTPCAKPGDKRTMSEKEADDALYDWLDRINTK